MRKFFYCAMLIIPVLSLLIPVLSLTSLHNSSLPLASHNSSLPLAPVGPPKKVTAFDFFYLVMQWRGSCPEPHCDPKTGVLPPNFTIHGLWPTNKTGKDPENCDKNDIFDPAKVTDLIKDMQTQWPSFKCPPNNSEFWSYEWRKHGTCSNRDQHSFVEKSLEINKKLGILQLLATARITPNGRLYSKARIENAIATITGFAPELECNSNNQLYQVYVCLDVINMDYIPCPSPKKSFKCGSNIAFPPYM